MRRGVLARDVADLFSRRVQRIRKFVLVVHLLPNNSLSILSCCLVTTSIFWSATSCFDQKTTEGTLAFYTTQVGGFKLSHLMSYYAFSRVAMRPEIERRLTTRSFKSNFFLFRFAAAAASSLVAVCDDRSDRQTRNPPCRTTESGRYSLWKEKRVPKRSR